MLRIVTRFGVSFVLSFSLVVLFIQMLRPERTAFSCRSIGACLGRNSHSYEFKLPFNREVSTSEVRLHDGTRRFDRKLQNATATTLFLVLNRDGRSYSKDFLSAQRTAYDLLDLLVSTKLNLTDVSLSLMTTSESEYENLKDATATFPLARTTILLRNDTGPAIPYAQRHNDELQLSRRSNLASLRNYLMLRALQDEEHIIWIDADVVAFSEGIVQRMINHSSTKEHAGILTARCKVRTKVNYDENAWRINRQFRELLDPIADNEQAATIHKLAKTRLPVPDIIKGTHDDEIKPLDSVGGTILYIRSDLVRQGVNFPSYNIVGTTWRHAGWTGVETEGICYAAEQLMKANQCWVLGGNNFVRHSDFS